MEITVSLNQPFSVEIESNRSTGYMWFIKNPNQNILKPLNLTDNNSSKDYIKSKPQCKGRDCPIMMFGVPGYDLFKFKPIKIGKVELNFIYQRPWMMNDPPEMEKTLIVNIQG